MPYKNIDEEDKELIKTIKFTEKYSKKLLIGGAGSVVLIGAYFLLSPDLNLNSINKSIYEMNYNELISNSLLGISSFSGAAGGIMYGISNFMKYDFGKHLKSRKTKTDKNIERNLKD